MFPRLRATGSSALSQTSWPSRSATPTREAVITGTNEMCLRLSISDSFGWRKGRWRTLRDALRFSTQYRRRPRAHWVETEEFANEKGWMAERKGLSDVADARPDLEFVGSSIPYDGWCKLAIHR